MPAQHLYPLRAECVRRETAQSRMRWSVHEKHLLDHELSDGVERRKPHLTKLLRRWRALRRITMKHRHYVLIAGDNPCVQKRIPMHRVLGPESMEMRIRIRPNLGV